MLVLMLMVPMVFLEVIHLELEVDVSGPLRLRYLLRLRGH